MLARAVNSALYADMKVLLENMLAVGLSPSLTHCLRVLAQEIPTLRKDIQEGLLKMLSLILMNKPLRHPGAPKAQLSSQQGGKLSILCVHFLTGTSPVAATMPAHHVFCE